MSTRYFAIGFKNWVEVRAADKPPTKRRTFSTREVPVPDWRTIRYLSDGSYRFGKYVPKKYKISCVNFNGGKVLGTVNGHSFVGLMGFGVPMNEMIEINSTQVKALAKKGISLDG